MGDHPGQSISAEENGPGELRHAVVDDRDVSGRGAQVDQHMGPLGLRLPQPARHRQRADFHGVDDERCSLQGADVSKNQRLGGGGEQHLYLAHAVLGDLTHRLDVDDRFIDRKR